MSTCVSVNAESAAAHAWWRQHEAEVIRIVAGYARRLRQDPDEAIAELYAMLWARLVRIPAARMAHLIPPRILARIWANYSAGRRFCRRGRYLIESRRAYQRHGIGRLGLSGPIGRRIPVRQVSPDEAVRIEVDHGAALADASPIQRGIYRAYAESNSTADIRELAPRYRVCRQTMYRERNRLSRRFAALGYVR